MMLVVIIIHLNDLGIHTNREKKQKDKKLINFLIIKSTGYA